MSEGLSQSEVERYFEDGVLFPVSILTPEEAADLQNSLQEVWISLLSEPGASSDSLQYLPWERREHPLFPIIDEVVCHPKILGVVASILGDHLLVRNCDIFFKDAIPMTWTAIDGFQLNHGGIAWHADEIWGPDSDKMLTAWLALTPTDEKNGAVEYILGSHRVEIPNPITDRGDLDYTTKRLRHLEDLSHRTTSLTPGEMSLHHANVVHGSPPNLAQTPRIGLAIRYFTPAVPPEFSGCKAARLVRGERTKDVYQMRSKFTVNWWVPDQHKKMGGESQWTHWKEREENTWHPETTNDGEDLGDLQADPDGGYSLSLSCILDINQEAYQSLLAQMAGVAIGVFPEEHPRKEAKLYIPPVASTLFKEESLEQITEWQQEEERARITPMISIPASTKRGLHRVEVICAWKNRSYQRFSLPFTLI